MPKIDLFVTTILSNPALRGRHERAARHLHSARVPYTSHDVASDEEAKKLWKRKAGTNTELPCIIVDGERVGSMENLDEAAEFGELRQFLRLDTTTPTTTTTTTPIAEGSKPADESSTSGPGSTKATLDDFASLDLTPQEIAQLEKEISSGSSFSSALPTPSIHSTSFETVAPVAPLKFSKWSKNGEKVDVTRALGKGDRPLAQDQGGTEDINWDELNDEEMERLAKELDLEGSSKDASKGSVATTVQSESQLLPSDKHPDKPKATLSPDEVNALMLPKDLLERQDQVYDLSKATAVEGMGGSRLSKTVGEVDQLKLSPDEVETIKKEIESPVLKINPVIPVEGKIGKELVSGKASDEEIDLSQDTSNSLGKSSAAEIQKLKVTLMENGVKDEELPSLGVEDVIPSKP